MLEKDLRKLHRNLAISLVIFIVLQALTGLLITLGEIRVPHSHAHEAQQDTVEKGNASLHSEVGLLQGFSNVVHHGGGIIGAVYRIVLGLGILGVAISGTIIYFKIRARTKAKR